MIIEFEVANYRSLRDGQVLSMVAEGKEDHEEFTFQPDGLNLSLLKSCVIYGANASGKTNVLRALRELQRLVVRSSDLKVGDTIPTAKSNFKLDAACANKPVSFALEFICSDQVRNRLFVAVDKEHGVVEEKLESYPLGRARLLYHRIHGEPISFGDALKGHKKSIEESLLDNVLFLSKAANNNLEQLIPIYMYFKNLFEFCIDKESVAFFSPTTERIAGGDNEFSDRVLSFLKAADTGIEGISIKKYEENMDIEGIDDAPAVIKKMIRESFQEVPHLGHMQFGELDNKIVSFPLGDESKGTQELYRLAGIIIEVLDSGGVLAIDEIEGSLHPEISAMIFHVFNSKKLNPHNAQLIATTHDTALLNRENFRRDQIWFTERDENGVSSLYSLLEFKKSNVRKNAPWREWYMDGRFDAVPVVDEDLLESVVRGVEDDG